MLIRIRRTISGDRGASAVEYGLLIAAIAAVVASVVFLLGGKVKAAFTQTCTSIASTSTASTC
jgi:pilus assembly protein Flp/PilA